MCPLRCGSSRSGGRPKSLASIALAGVASLTLALLTWSVSDPSLNHATNARVHNLLGAPGAIAADLVMQFLGLASAALLTPPAFWGWSLVTQRRLERPRLKVGLYLIGVIAAAGLASLLPAPGSWPLPTGLGGVVGDAVLALPHRLLPASAWATIALGCSLAAIAILCLAGASGVGGSPSSPEDAPDTTAGKARARALARFDDEDDEDEPSFGMVSIGAVIHALLTAKATLRRMASRGSRKRASLAHPHPCAGARLARALVGPADADDISTIAAALRAPRSGLGAFSFRRRAAGRLSGFRPRRAAARAAADIVEPAARRMGHALDHDVERAEEIGRRQDLAGRAGAERAPARGRPRRFRREGRDRQRAPWPGRRPLRTRAGAGNQILAGDRARRRHRPLDVGGLGPRGGRSGPQRHRHRIAEPAPRHRLSARASRQRRFQPIEPSPADRARQDHRRRAGDRRPHPHAPPPGRRHHRLGQVGRDQHHDPLAPLPHEARAMPAHHGRSEDARALGLRRHPASPDPRRHRSEEGGHRAQMGGEGDGGALQEDVEGRRAQYRRLQRPRRRGRRQRRGADPHASRPASTARPARRSTSPRRSRSTNCPISSSSSTRWRIS